MKLTFREENNYQHITILVLVALNYVFNGIIIILLVF